MNKHGELRHQVREFLGAMGSSRAEVAETLFRLGVRAVPKDAQGCAMAVYLKAVLGPDPRVQSLAVGKDAVKVVTDECPLRWLHRSNIVRVTLPDPVRNFIAAFDEAIYLNLMREEGHIPLGEGNDTEVLSEFLAQDNEGAAMPSGFGPA